MRAKVQWNTTIQPITHRRLKVFDPELQARAILGKLIARGIAPGAEPWKVLLRHRASEIQYRRGRL